MGVDSTTVYTDLNKRGRASVRVESKKLYNGGLFIADIAHMPSSVCGVWPAFWTSGQQNAVTLHTGTTDCTLSKAAQGGSLVTSHCSNYYADHVTQWENQGCSVDSTDSTNNYGDGFNSVGGGIYALVSTDGHWFPIPTDSYYRNGPERLSRSGTSLASVPMVSTL
jgi:hypothetical protein